MRMHIWAHHELTEIRGKRQWVALRRPNMRLDTFFTRNVGGETVHQSLRVFIIKALTKRCFMLCCDVFVTRHFGLVCRLNRDFRVRWLIHNSQHHHVMKLTSRLTDFCLVLRTGESLRSWRHTDSMTTCTRTHLYYATTHWQSCKAGVQTSVSRIAIFLTKRPLFENRQNE